jgi:hypothetical protein
VPRTAGADRGAAQVVVVYDLGLSEHARTVVGSWERVGVRRLRAGDPPSASAHGDGRRDPTERGALSEWDVLHTAAAEMQHVLYGAHASATARRMRRCDTACGGWRAAHCAVRWQWPKSKPSAAMPAR